MKFKKLSLMQWKKAVFYAIFISMIVLQLVNADNNIWGNGIDEAYYKDVTQRIVDKGTVQGSFDILKGDFETKTAPFIGLHVVLRMYETKVYARAFNFALIVLITIVIYDMSKRKEAFLTPIIFWMLNGVWLTDEIVEVVPVLLAIRFAKVSGVLLGIATLLRPYALFYTPLFNRKQWKYVLVIGFMYVIVLLYYNSFFFYLYKVFSYSVLNYSYTSGNEPPDFVAILFAFLFMFLGYKTKMFWFGMVGLIPTVVKGYAHYFIPAYVFFFVGYLVQLKELSANKKDKT